MNKVVFDAIGEVLGEERIITRKAIQDAEERIADEIEKRLAVVSTQKGDPGADGRAGADGRDGASGRGIASIRKSEENKALVIFDDGSDVEIELPRGPQGLAGEKGEPGLDGAAADPEAVAEAIKKDASFRAVLKGDKGERGEPGEKGLPGENGRDAAPEAVAEALVNKYGDFLTGKQGERGEPGEPGRNADPETVAAIVKADEAFRSVIKGDPGERGEPGADGVIVLPFRPQPGQSIDKNQVVFDLGGLHQAIRKTIGTPKEDPESYRPILSGVSEMRMSENWRTRKFEFTARLSDGLTEKFEFPMLPKAFFGKPDCAVIAGDHYYEGDGVYVATKDAPEETDWAYKNLRGPQGEKGDRGSRGREGKPGVSVVDVHMPGDGYIHFEMSNGDTIKSLFDLKPEDDDINQEIKRFAGWWKAGESYSSGDVVRSASGLYVCTESTRSSELGDPSYWVQMLAKDSSAGAAQSAGPSIWPPIVTSDLHMNGFRVIGLSAPLQSDDAATKGYVDQQTDDVFVGTTDQVAAQIGAGAADATAAVTIMAPLLAGKPLDEGDMVIVQKTANAANDPYEGLWIYDGVKWIRVATSGTAAPAPTIYPRPTLLAPQPTGSLTGDLEIVPKIGERQIREYDRASNLWQTIYSEPEVKSWIAASSLFQGVVDEAKLGTLPVPGTANKGMYWTWTGQPNHGVGNADARISPDLDGKIIQVGDWIQSDGTKWVHVPGNLLSKDRWTKLGGFQPWQDAAYENGSLVVYNGRYYRSYSSVGVGTGIPSDRNSPWQDITPQYKVGDLTDVDVKTKPAVTGDTLIYDKLLNKWRPGAASTQIPQWDATVNYAPNTLVQHNGQLYFSLSNNINSAPDITSQPIGGTSTFADLVSDMTVLPDLTPGKTPIETYDFINTNQTAGKFFRLTLSPSVSIPYTITAGAFKGKVLTQEQQVVIYTGDPSYGTDGWIIVPDYGSSGNYTGTYNWSANYASDWNPVGGIQVQGTPREGVVPMWKTNHWEIADITSPVLFVGTGAINKALMKDAISHYGFPSDAKPDPLLVAPHGGDLYFNLDDGIFYELTSISVATSDRSVPTADDFTEASKLKLSNLADISTTPAKNGDFLAYDGVNNVWAPQSSLTFATKNYVDTEISKIVTGVLEQAVEAIVSDPAAITPTEGQFYIVGPAPVGAWAGKVGQIAYYHNNAWVFSTPSDKEKRFVKTLNEERQYVSTTQSWQQVASAGTGGKLVGEIVMWPTLKVPAGYLLCDGGTFDALAYPKLYQVLGNDVTPDMRGQFVRGWSNNSAQDPGGPRAPGSYQGFMIQSHSHTFAGPRQFAPFGQYQRTTWEYETPGNRSTDATGGAETRPKNIAMAFIICAI